VFSGILITLFGTVLLQFSHSSM